MIKDVTIEDIRDGEILAELIDVSGVLKDISDFVFSWR